MGFVIGLLTFIMVLDCLLLILLVLIQLPKKEAGAGLAFGGGATDALFGAGSGNVLTKITKYAAGIFFGLALFIGILQKTRISGTSDFEKRLAGPGRTPPAAVPAPPASTTPVTGTNVPILEAPTNPPAEAPRITAPVVVTNAPAQATATNAPPQK
jgi:preprotein translocase subunit SecG